MSKPKQYISMLVTFTICLMLITMLVSAVCAFLLGLLVKRVRGLKWMTDFVMSISMIAGMAAAVLIS